MKYFVVNNTSRAANYGIGTYISQLKECLVEKYDIELSFIDMCADVKEYTIERDATGNAHYKIPQIVHIEDSLYCKNAFYFLVQQLYPTDNERYVFHFNFFQHYQLALRLKSFLPNCHIVLTVHYWGWGFALNGNTTKFKQYIQQESLYPEKNLDNEEKYASIKNDIVNNYIHDRKFLCLADSIITLSIHSQNLILKDYQVDASKVSMLYNGLEDSGLQWNKGNPSEGNVQNILFVGRLDDAKGVHYLMKAFRNLYHSNHSLHLYIVGDGDFGKYLSYAEDIWEAVTFTGKVDREKIISLYKKATVGVLPSFNEQCSYTAIEMMMYGIPFVGTDSTGLKEMLMSVPDNIVHINEYNFEEAVFVEDLTKKMERLLRDDSYRRHSSKTMRETYTKFYSMDKMTSQYQHLISSITNQETLIANDMLLELDKHMISLINSRPDIDMSFFGMTGIGYYIWRRICGFKNRSTKEDVVHNYMLQEHMIYFLDWMINEIKDNYDSEINTSSEFYALISELYADGFYQTAVNMIIEILNLNMKEPLETVTTKSIYGNALKIYCYE